MIRASPRWGITLVDWLIEMSFARFQSNAIYVKGCLSLINYSFQSNSSAFIPLTNEVNQRKGVNHKNNGFNAIN